MAAVATLALACAVPIAARADTGPCGTDIGKSLPDLIVDPVRLAQYVSVADEKYAPTSCAVQEGFVPSPGWHTLMRFETATPNIGLGTLVIGNPQTCLALFEQSTCHGHFHFKEYTDYRLWTPAGYDTWLARRDLGQPTNTGVNAAALNEAAKNKSLVSGRKMGFCMVDSMRYTTEAGAAPVFVSCMTNQGLSVGWSDIYSSTLDGQYIEIDSLKAGDYVVEIHVNPEHLLAESDYLNNSSAIKVRYTPGRGGALPSIQVLP